jgi:hypothetical protein
LLTTGALPSSPLGPWQAKQLCIEYQRLPSSGLPRGALQAANIRAAKKKTSMTGSQRNVDSAIPLTIILLLVNADLFFVKTVKVARSLIDSLAEEI